MRIDDELPCGHCMFSDVCKYREDTEDDYKNLSTHEPWHNEHVHISINFRCTFFHIEDKQSLWSCEEVK